MSIQPDWPVKAGPRPQLKRGEYQHYKGEVYTLEGVAMHSEDNRWMCVYRRKSDGEVFVRPAEMWGQLVKSDVHTQGHDVPRFRYIGAGSV